MNIYEFRSYSKKHGIENDFACAAGADDANHSSAQHSVYASICIYFDIPAQCECEYYRMHTQE